MASFSIYSLPHNDVAAALAFARAHWDELRPEDFTTLARLNEAHSAELLAGLARLKRERDAKKGKKSGAVLLYRAVPYARVQAQLTHPDVLVDVDGVRYRVVEAQEAPLTKWVRVVRVRDGKIIQVKREVALAKPHKYKPLQPIESVPSKPREVPPEPPGGGPKWVRVLRLRDNKIVQVRREKANQPDKYKPLGPGSVPPKPPPESPKAPPKAPPKKPPSTETPLAVPEGLILTEHGEQLWREMTQIPALRDYITTNDEKVPTKARAARAFIAYHLFRNDSSRHPFQPATAEELDRYKDGRLGVDTMRSWWDSDAAVSTLLSKLHEHHDWPADKFSPRTEAGERLWQRAVQNPIIREFLTSPLLADERRNPSIARGARLRTAVAAYRLFHHDQTGEHLTDFYPHSPITIEDFRQAWESDPKVSELLDSLYEHAEQQQKPPPVPPDAPDLPPPSTAKAMGEEGQLAWHATLQVPALRQHVESVAPTADSLTRARRAQEALMAFLIHQYEQTGKIPAVATGIFNARTLRSWSRVKGIQQLLPQVHQHFGTAAPPTKPIPHPHESLASLKAALHGRQTAYLPTMATERYGKWLLKTQLTPKHQRAVREHLSNILASFGLHNHAGRLSGSRRFLMASQLHEDGDSFVIWGLHFGDGTVMVRQDVLEGALRFLDNPPRASEEDISRFRTLIHEEVHGHSPKRNGVYRDTGAFLEEATTELASRHILGGVLGRSMLHRGSYQREIDRLTELTTKTMLKVGRKIGKHGIFIGHETKDLAAAAVEMRKQQPRMRATPESYIKLFAEAYAKALPNERFHGFAGEADTEQREQIRRKLSKELERQLRDSKAVLSDHAKGPKAG
jgi:hypothetical protein